VEEFGAVVSEDKIFDNIGIEIEGGGYLKEKSINSEMLFSP
jgi:hypothetical protein